ncbi:hypothetical protein [Rickettsiales endosymbiont of Peranema trichophorum]|nr:hypothetical protein [Rickettsiales endosymbiont of Peranema trichophorum]
MDAPFQGNDKGGASMAKERRELQRGEREGRRRSKVREGQGLCLSITS